MKCYQYYPNFINENYLNELESLILLADTKGINLIFLVPPLIHENFYAELKSIYDRLPARQKIEVTNAKKYAKLYEVENVYDPVHLNEKGIAIYSKLVAEKFVEITQIKADKKGQKNNIGNKNTNNKKQEDGDKKLNKTEKEKQTNLKNKRKQGKNTHEKKPLDKNN